MLSSVSGFEFYNTVSLVNPENDQDFITFNPATTTKQAYWIARQPRLAWTEIFSNSTPPTAVSPPSPSISVSATSPTASDLSASSGASSSTSMASGRSKKRVREMWCFCCQEDHPEQEGWYCDQCEEWCHDLCEPDECLNCAGKMLTQK